MRWDGWRSTEMMTMNTWLVVEMIGLRALIGLETSLFPLTMMMDINSTITTVVTCHPIYSILGSQFSSGLFWLFFLQPSLQFFTTSKIFQCSNLIQDSSSSLWYPTSTLDHPRLTWINLNKESVVMMGQMMIVQHQLQGTGSQILCLCVTCWYLWSHYQQSSSSALLGLDRAMGDISGDDFKQEFVNHINKLHKFFFRMVLPLMMIIPLYLVSALLTLTVLIIRKCSPCFKYLEEDHWLELKRDYFDHSNLFM